MNGSYGPSGNRVGYIQRFFNTGNVDSSVSTSDSMSLTSPNSSLDPCAARLGDQSTDDSVGEGVDVKGKVEARLLSMWNNMKFGWNVKLKTSFSKESPVWLLGRCYHRKTSPTASIENSTELATEAASDAYEGEGLEGFRLDFTSRLWFTYRRDFPALGGHTTDCGWGCMLRAGQMLMAQALVAHFLGRTWRWNPERGAADAREYREECRQRAIITWFGDRQSASSPLSVHRLVAAGAALGKRPGDWFGPASVAHCLASALREASQESHELAQLVLHVAQDGAVRIPDILADASRDGTTWQPLILLIPVKLGADKLNPAYAPCLTALLTLEQCIGIIGGRPGHALYFVGFQDDKLVHLDPHYCQDTVDVRLPDFPLASFHCRSPRKMPLSKVDPSCCIGFYFAIRREFDVFCEVVKPFVLPQGLNSAIEHPIFCISDNSINQLTNQRNVRYSIYETDQSWFAVNNCDTDIESEEFVIV